MNDKKAYIHVHLDLNKEDVNVAIQKRKRGVSP